MARESRFQTHLIKRLGEMFPGCFISKMDPEYTQGIPDLLILWRKHWAMLEVKAEANATQQPNQAWYVSELNKMSFAAFIYPENEEEVLRGLEQAFRPARSTRVSVRK